MSGCDRELSAHFYSATSLKYHVPDMISHPVTLSWHWVDQSQLYSVSLSAKRGAAGVISTTLVRRGPGSNPWPPHCRIQIALSALTCRFSPLWIMGDIMRIARRCTLISLSAIISQNRLNPVMQRAKIDRSVRRALPVYDNGDLPFLGADTLPTELSGPVSFERASSVL